MEAWAESPEGEFGACVGVCIWGGVGTSAVSAGGGSGEVEPGGTGPEGQQEQDLEHAARSSGGGRALCSLLSAGCAEGCLG